MLRVRSTLAGGYLAVTCMTSAMTRNQVISFILSW